MIGLTSYSRKCKKTGSRPFIYGCDTPLEGTENFEISTLRLTAARSASELRTHKKGVEYFACADISVTPRFTY